MNGLLLSGALEYLESCPGVSVESTFNPPIVPIMINNWESRQNVKLPQDLLEFLSVSDGLFISWSVSLTFDKLRKTWTDDPKEAIKIGCISINSLQDMVLKEIGNFQALEIQDISPYGKVCLVYSEGKDTSIKLWLNDEWTLLSKDFSSYFRLQIRYLGIKGWQLSRTRDGMPQDSSDWLSFYVPYLVNNRSDNVVKKREVSMDKIQKLITIMSSRE